MWSIKNVRSFSVFDICQPGGNGPRSSLVTVIEAVALPAEPAAAGVIDALLELFESTSSAIWCRSLTCCCGRGVVVLEKEILP